MAYTSWRGVVGVIKPTMRPGSVEELIRILPDGVGMIPIYLDIRGAKSEFHKAIAGYEPKIRELAEQEVDLIHPEGAPPFQLAGFKAEREILKGWEKKYGIPMFTSSSNQVRALKAMGIKSFVGSRGTSWDNDGTVARYFTDAGFEVLEVAPIVTPFDRVGQISAYEAYSHIKKLFLRHPKADGIHLQGSGWRILDIIEMLEQDLGVPVVHAVTARCWEIQRRLNIRQPVPGGGRLLTEMPDG